MTSQKRADRQFPGKVSTTSGIPFFVRFLWLGVLSLGISACGGEGPGESNETPASGSPAPALDPEGLERIEDLSESLANDLLDLSVAARQSDRERAATFFAENLTATPFPETPAPGVFGTDGTSGESAESPASTNLAETRSAIFAMTHSWPVPERTELTREAFMAGWDRLFGQYSEVEDVRFKVKKASFEGTRGSADLAFYIVGRDLHGRRLWIRGRADAEVLPASGQAADPAADVEALDFKIHAFAYRQLDAMVAATDIFSEVSRPAGLAQTRARYGTPENEGFVWHGAAAGFVDGDAHLDLFVTGPDRNYLYLNRGDGTFREAAAEALVGQLLEVGVAPLLVDYDGDGDSDLFISAVGSQMLLENRLVPEGTAVFQDVSARAGVSVPAIGFSAVAGDIDGNGWPDIFVASYNRYGAIMPNGWDDADNGTPNLLFLNRGDGTFVESAAAWGLRDTRWSYAAALFDLDADSDLDLYVANDFGTNALYRNDGGTFVDVANAAGVVDPGNGMGVALGDYDNDGDLDLHVTNMSSTAGNRILGRIYKEGTASASPGSGKGDVLRKLAAGNSLYEQEADGSWKDVTASVGGFSAGWAWGGGFLDVDNDGWEDLYSPNGFVSGKLLKDT